MERDRKRLTRPGTCFSPMGLHGRNRSHTSKTLERNDYLFLFGLAFFLLYVFFSHPGTPGLGHLDFLFFASLASVALSVAPDLVDTDKIRRELREPGDRMESVVYAVFSRALDAAEDMEGSHFVALALVSLSLGVFLFLFRSELNYVVLGTAYGFLMRGLLD